MFEKILVGIDGSAPSDNALWTACDLAKKYDSKLYLVHSPQVETTAIAVGSGAVEIAPDRASVEAAGKHVMDLAIEKAKSFGCEPDKNIIANGDPAADILKGAEDTNADLIVMGRRGLGGVASVLLGSVSQKVIHGADCTCMTVKH